ncbi:hypothetical protein TWF106_007381 [Orbilia oligospora]|uniref:Uncharacterized protein n=1 Tax=Orbilia oligospora TaxID=2813651 RepID=A0A6G1MD50_ORBOL|nr:hypothetical protein TWF106_007381 [Orbilia oligospora]KAF3228570.1 hypothetical protein TWF191_002426 [Orbilia oligospora]KAF3252922.1 hypothetical protein TWF192_004207 [Orbilia oligospora]
MEGSISGVLKITFSPIYSDPQTGQKQVSTKLYLSEIPQRHLTTYSYTMVFFFGRKKAPPEGAEYIPPSLSLVWWNYRASTESFQWWLPYIRIPAQMTYEGILKFVGFSIGFTCVWMYIVGIIALAVILYNGEVSFLRLQLVGLITMYISVSAGTTISATDGEFLWIFKWSLLNNHSFTLEEIQKILDGDSGFQSIKNLVMGPNRARLLSLYLLLTRTGSRVGLAFLASSYEVLRYPSSSGNKLYDSRINWGYAVGGLVLLVVIQSLITIISVICIRSGSTVPPNTALGLSLALRPCLKPLRDSGGTVDTSSILKALKGDSPKYSLQIVNIQGASVAQFTLASGEHEPAVTSHQQKKLEQKTKLFFTSTNFFTSPLLPFLFSLITAYLIYILLVSQYIRTDFPIQLQFGNIGNKLLLSILLQIYGLFLGAFAETILHIVRWGCISSNKTDLTLVESLLVANNWWNLSSFRFFSPGGLRGRVTKWISAFQTRATVTAVGWAILMEYYGRLAKMPNNYWIAAVCALAASFGMVAAMWVICAGTLAHKKLIPEANSLPKAHAFRKLAAQLETTGSLDQEVQYGRVETSTREWATAVSGGAEPFLAGTYL